MNSIFSVKCYQRYGQWVFDDPSRDIYAEPLLAGADTAIDILSSKIANARRGFVLTFSDAPFEGSQLSARYVADDGKSGYWYYIDRHLLPMWLCPVLIQYWPEAPSALFAMASEMKFNWFEQQWHKVLDWLDR